MDHGTMANHQELDLVGNVGALLGFDVIIIEENINELNENMVNAILVMARGMCVGHVIWASAHYAWLESYQYNGDYGR